MIIDQEFKDLIPPLKTEEYNNLEASILEEGCRDALVIWGDILVDGHNRYDICKKHDITYKTEYREFSSREQAKIWIRRNQLARRNLPDVWIVTLNMGIAEDLAKEGKEKLSEIGKLYGEGHPKQEPLSTVDKPSDTPPKHRSRELLAKKLGIGQTKLAEAQYVMRNAPELWQEAKDNELPIHYIYKKTKQQENMITRKDRVLTETKEAIILPAYVCNTDCLSVLKDLEPIDLLIADPPYFTDGDFTKHIEQCLKKVKDTGQAYVFMSSSPEELSAYLNIDSSPLVLTQMLVWNYNNTGQRQPNDRYNSNYQVFFYYRGINAPDINKPSDGKQQYACQTINAPDGRIGDRYHSWQKPIELIDRLIYNSSKEGDFVFDPFAGTGTTMLSASKLGRRSLGCEIDSETIKICIERGCMYE